MLTTMLAAWSSRQPDETNLLKVWQRNEESRVTVEVQHITAASSPSLCPLQRSFSTQANLVHLGTLSSFLLFRRNRTKPEPVCGYVPQEVSGQTPLQSPNQQCYSNDWVMVLRSTPHKIGHFDDVSQANLVPWYGKTKPNTTKAHVHQWKEMYYNTK